MIAYGVMFVCAYAVQGAVSEPQNGDQAGLVLVPGCMCTRELRPVCGSDGFTYPNPCTFDCANEKQGGRLQSSPSSCPHRGKRQTDPCLCARIYDPVCGTDGKTYGNKCSLDCAKSKHENLELKSLGSCQDQVEDSCVCPYIYKPVCGSDGNTYPSECSLNCAKSRNKGLEVRNEGECPKTNCVCTFIYKPVCGSDGKTYGNECTLNCAKSTNSKLKLQSPGACQNQLREKREYCACTLIYRPVCGSDGKTYPNECSLNCDKNKNKGLEMKHEGECLKIK